MKYVSPWKKRLLVGLTILSSLSILSSVRTVDARPAIDTEVSRLKIETGPLPPTDPIDNESKPAGTLDPSDPCATETVKLTALVPPNNSFSSFPELAGVPVLTVSAQPTLLFYVPYTSSEVRYGEFSIAEWPDEQASPPYEMRFTLPQTPGIVSVSPTPSSNFSLEVEKDYRWRLRLYCGPGDTASDYVILRGTMRRIAESPETDALISTFSPDIWYDSIARLANQMRTTVNPDESLTLRWFELLSLVELEEEETDESEPGESELEILGSNTLVGPVIRIDQ